MVVMPAGVVMLALLLSSPGAMAGEGPRREAVVTVAFENMYSGPDTALQVVSQATLGQLVQILERQDGLVRIQTPDQYAGWIPEAALASYPEASTVRYASQGRVLKVSSLMASLYREPDPTSARPKLLAPLGTLLELLPSPLHERWHAVRLPNAEVAFIQASEVTVRDASEPEPKAAGADLVATARRFLGVPYVWGGMTAHGLDCSGLVSRVYAFHGYRLRRDADLQFEDERMAPVAKADLQAGDLLFFGGEQITHVGLYEGEGRFLHATTRDRPEVQESQLGDPHWAGQYQGARRPR
jgi:cell wall-associated NlpC family hydrolase